MAEEEVMDDVDTGVSDEPATQDADTQDADDGVDWKARAEEAEARAKDFEARHTQLSQESARQRELFEAMQMVRGTQPQPEQPEEDPEEFATIGRIKQLESKLEQAERRLQLSQVGRDFLEKNPDLKPHEKWLGRLVLETDPRLPVNKRLENAAQELRDFIKSQRDAAMQEATADKTDAKKKAAKASNLDAASAGAPKPKKDNEPETYEQYVAYRKQASLKGQGLR